MDIQWIYGYPLDIWICNLSLTRSRLPPRWPGGRHRRSRSSESKSTGKFETGTDRLRKVRWRVCFNVKNLSSTSPFS